MYQSPMTAASNNSLNMNSRLQRSLPLKYVQKPVSAPTLYRIRFYTRRLLRHFRYLKFSHVLTFFFTVIITLSFFSILSQIASVVHRYHSPSDSTNKHIKNSDENDRDDARSTVFHVATARVNITPDEPVFISGFSTRKSAPSRALLADPTIPLYVRALSIRYHSRNESLSSSSSSIPTTLLFISLDIIAIPQSLSHRIHEHALTTHGLPSSHVVLCASHTHSGPAIGDALAPLSPHDAASRAAIARYETQLERAIRTAMSSALARPRVRAVTASFSRASAPLAVNRRQIRESDYVAGTTRRGDTLDSVPVLAFRDVNSDALIAAMFGFTAHPTILTRGLAYSGDYPAVVAHALENHPQFINDQTNHQKPPIWLFAPGPAGDQNIYPRSSSRWLRRHARLIASAAARAAGMPDLGVTDEDDDDIDDEDDDKTNNIENEHIHNNRNRNNNKNHSQLNNHIYQGNHNIIRRHLQHKRRRKFSLLFWRSTDDARINKNNKDVSTLLEHRSISGSLSARATRIELPFAARYSEAELRKRAREGGTPERRAVRVLLPHVRSAPDGLTPAAYPYPVTIWRVGDVVMAFLAGEPTVGYANLLAPLGVHWVVGYANDVMGYVGTADVIRGGGREGSERAAWYYGLPATWSVRAPELIARTVRKLVVSVSATQSLSTSSIPNKKDKE